MEEFEHGLIIGNRYQLQDCLGQGKIGSVYRAQDLQNKIAVAIKLPHPRHARNPEFASRFHRRYLTGMREIHPVIVRCLDTGDFSGVPYLVTELVEGQPLDVWFESVGRDYEALAELLDPLLEALAAAHQGRIYHQELKPSNLLVEADGRPRILDLGLAGRLEDQLGPPDLYRVGVMYLSPEQAVGARGDERSDLYALGAILYHLAAGKPPFSGQALSELLVAHLNDVPLPLAQVRSTVPSWLEELVHRLLQKAPADRPSGALEVQSWIRRRRTLVNRSAEERLPALYGREKELAIFDHALRGLGQGNGASLWLSGPAGIGCTRLCQEWKLRSHGATPFIMLSVSGHEQLSLHHWMRHPLIGSERVPERLEELSADRPLVILVDGAEKCDESSLSLLGELAELSRFNPLLLIVTAEEGFGFPLRTKFSEEIVLTGLDREGCAALVEERLWAAPPAEAVSWLTKHTAGNPYFLKLLLERLEGKSLSVDMGDVRWRVPALDEVPASLDLLLAKMPEEEGPEGRELLGISACLGEQFELNLLKALVIYAPRQLETFLEGLVRRGWLQEQWVAGVVGYRFAHPSRWAAALDVLPARRQRRIHLLVGAFLERSLRSPDDYERAALHYEKAREMESALRMLARCLEQALEREAWLEARTWMKRCQLAGQEVSDTFSADCIFPSPWNNFGWASVHESTGLRHFLAAQMILLGRFSDALWQLQIAFEEGLEDDLRRLVENHLLRVVVHLKDSLVTRPVAQQHLKQALEHSLVGNFSELASLSAALQIQVERQ